MQILSFLLALGLVGTMVGVGVGLLCFAAATLIDAVAGHRLSPSMRSELWLATGVIPALGPAVVVVAGGGAAVAAALGIGDHHCLAHLHHLHLCPVHLGADGQTLVAWQAFVGGGAWAAVSLRLLLQARRSWATRELVKGLTAHAPAHLDAAGAVLVVDGPPSLMHAVGDVVIASRALLDRLTPLSREAALAHERGHLRRRDPLALEALAFCAAVSPPVMGAIVRRRFVAAAEDAADDHAALHVGGEAVAHALVEVARLRLSSRLDAALPAVVAAGGVDVERRVLRLLSDLPRRPAAPGLVLVGAVMLGVAGLCASDAVHHAAETLLAVVSP